MDEERFLSYVWDVYYYSLDQRWKELKNILFLFSDECNCKSGMLLFYLAKHGDMEYLIEYMDTLRRGRDIDLKEVQEDYIKALQNRDMDFAKYLLGFMNSRGKGTHQEIYGPFIDFAYNFVDYKETKKKYATVDDDLDLEDDLYDILRGNETIKDITSNSKFESQKKDFMMHLYNNIDTYSCTDRKGKYHTYAKVNEEILDDIDVQDVIDRVEYQLYLGNTQKARDIVSDALKHTKGFEPDLVRLYNKVYKDSRIYRLERHICEPYEEDNSYNILYNYDYNIDNVYELVEQAFKNKEINLSGYTDEEKGLIYGIIAREAYKNNKTSMGDKYFRLACNYYKKNPEVNYFLKYIDDNKGNLSYQVVRSLSDEVKLQLTK